MKSKTVGKHHIVVYNDKRIVMDDLDPREEFKYACMRIMDNGASGFVICPDGKTYAITQGSKKARLIKSQEEGNIF